ncbi:unnamed protein product [Ambrosiozyma monospora]|uniref:Unnamed protein product n=1 Tax=Ambrosiozyma monospora TaxID=43982 RepID=A0A9W6YWX9_AMBMO|nr:unnamed protein product [Ambrosiozyma monospora]
MRGISYPQRLASLSIKLGFDNFENEYVGVVLSKCPENLGYLKFMQYDENTKYRFYWKNDEDQISTINLKKDVISIDGDKRYLLKLDCLNVELEGDWTVVTDC